MIKVLSRTQTHLLVAIVAAAIALLTCVWFAFMGLDDPQENCEKLRDSASKAMMDQQYARAEQLFEQACSQARKAKNPLMLASTLGDLSNTDVELKQFDKSETHLREELSILAKVTTLPTDHSIDEAYLDAVTKLANTLEREGKSAEAIATYKKAVSLADSSQSRISPEVFERYCELLEHAGRKEELAEIKLANDIAYGGIHDGGPHFWTGMKLVLKHKWKEADREFDAALAIGRRWKGPEIIVEALCGKAMIKIEKKQIGEAESFLQEAQAILDSSTKPMPDQRARTAVLTATCLANEGKTQMAQALDAQATRQSPVVAISVLGDLSDPSNNENKPETRIVYLLRELKMVQKVKGSQSRQYADTIAWIGHNYNYMHNIKKAIYYYERALPLLERTVGADSASLISVLDALSVEYEVEKRYKESNACLQEESVVLAKGSHSRSDFARLQERLATNAREQKPK